MADFARASLLEGIRFTAQVAVPNVIQGLFRRRRTAVAIATRTGADRLAIGLMAGLKRSHGEGPVWIRVANDEALINMGSRLPGGRVARLIEIIGDLEAEEEALASERSH